MMANSSQSLNRHNRKWPTDENDSGFKKTTKRSNGRLTMVDYHKMMTMMTIILLLIRSSSSNNNNEDELLALWWYCTELC